MKRVNYPNLGEELYTGTLPNGLPIYVVKKPGFSKKYTYFAANYGSIDTSFRLNGKTVTTPAGVAHYLEHKMFDLPDLDVMQAYSGLGASPNAFTSYDMTAYYFRCTEQFDRCLELLLRFVSTPYFTQESVDKERGIIAQEILMGEDSPDSKVYEDLFEIMYRSHPVRVPIAGSVESIGEITPGLLYDCHRTFYHPGNMVLSVVGDVDPERVEEIAYKTLPDTKPPEISRDYGPPEERTCPRRETVRNMDVAMPTFQLGFKCPAPGLGAENFRLQILGDLAAEALMGESSPLYQRLYEQRLIDSSFGGGFETMEDCAMLCASGDSEAPLQVRDAIIAEAARLAQTGIGEKDFLRMKRSALGRRIRGLDSLDGTCFRLCAYHFSNFDYFRFPEIYRDVTAGEVRAFLERWVRPDNCAISIIEPLKEGEDHESR